MLHVWLFSRLLCCRHSYCLKERKAVWLKATFDMCPEYWTDPTTKFSLYGRNVCVKWVRSAFHCWSSLNRNFSIFLKSCRHRIYLSLRHNFRRDKSLKPLFACCSHKSLQLKFLWHFQNFCHKFFHEAINIFSRLIFGCSSK